MSIFERLKKEIILESVDKIRDILLPEILSYYGGTIVDSSKGLHIGLHIAKIVLNNSNEVLLSSFFETCIFIKATKNLGGKGSKPTAGVIPYPTPYGMKTIFLYDEKFIDELSSFYSYDKEITPQEFLKKYKQNPDDPALKWDISKMLFLFAHEGMHIFRSHSDRSQSQNKNHNRYNIAADAVINFTLINKIKKIAGYDLKFIDGGVMLDRDKYLTWLKEKKYHTGKGTDDEEFDRNLNADKTYDFYGDNSPPTPPNPPEPPEPPAPVQVGDLRRILDNGPNHGKVVRINKVNNDGTYEMEIVDLKAIKDEARKKYLEKKANKYLRKESYDLKYNSKRRIK